MEQFPAFPLYCYFAVGLSLLLLSLDSLSAVVRVKTKTTINPEDAPKAQVVEEDVSSVARANRAWRNAFANTIPFLIIALLFVLTKATKNAALPYFATFAGARVLHAIAYNLGKQPWRTLCFVVGQLVTLGLSFHVVRYAASM
jgi:uncharacterized MAPEG superfamily protein